MQTTETHSVPETIALATLRAGDLITEDGTPAGPWLPVLKVNAKSVVVDADEAYGTEQADPLPVRVAFGRSTHVVARRAA